MNLYADQISVEPCPLHPRPYQEQAVDAVFKQWAAGRRSTLVQMATGTGKSSVGALIARRFPDHRGRVLILVNRDELVKQWVETLRFVCNNDECEVEQGERRANRNRYSLVQKYGKKRAFARIVVASKDTMWRERRLRTFDRDEFACIGIDECSSWCRENSTWNDIVEHFPGASVFGLDATPKRSDGKAMGEVFDSVACEYSLMDAVSDGWLVEPIQQYVMIDGFDLDSLRNVKGKDWSEKEIDRMLRQEKPLQAMAKQTVEHAVFEGSKVRRGHILSTLIFNASVDLARLMADILNRRHAMDGTGRAAVISCKDTDLDARRRILHQFESGQIKYLSNYGIVLKGYDNPNVEMVVLGRPTKFDALAVQMIGRSTRPRREITDALNAAGSAAERRAIIAASSKRQALILDPVGTTGVHSLAIDLTDILGGEYGGAVIQEAKSYAMRGEGRITKAEIEEAKARVTILEAEELKRRSDLVIDSTYITREIPAFDPRFGGGTGAEKAKARPEVPTPRMVELLKKGGIKQPEIDGLDFGDAGKLIGEIQKRWKGGLCSIAQERSMIRAGMTQAEVQGMTREAAKKAIDIIAKNGWRYPRGEAWEG